MFKIGTLADWFGVGLIEGIKESQRCGAQGVQIYAWQDFSPLTATKQDVSDVKQTAREHSQEIVALCGELGGHGFEIHEENKQKIEYLKKVVDMGTALDCKIITTHIGVIPENNTDEKYKAMLEASSVVGRYAKEHGAIIAIETGPEPVARLKAFAEACGGGIGINYDPANLIMVTNDDEVKGVYTAGNLIAHTHAKDGIMNEYVGPDTVYKLFAEGGIEALNQVDNYFKEMPLGKGSVRWEQYLTALKEIGYNGFLTVEREVHKDAKADIAMAVDFLKDIITKV